MGSDTRLTTDEKRALRGLRNITKVAYILCFREVMDFATCITGLTRRISWRAVWETIEEEPDWGAVWKPKELTIQKKQGVVKSINKEAIRAGLLFPVYKDGKKLPMVFECPLAYKGSASKKGTPNEGREERRGIKNNFSQNSCSYDNTGAEESRDDRSRNAPHLVSGNILNTKVFNNNINSELEKNLHSKNACQKSPSPPRPKPQQKLKTNNEIITRLFEFWKKTLNRHNAKLDEQRKRAIRKGLKLNFTEDDLKQAIIGCSKSEFHMGKNEQNKRYDSVGLIFRDAERIEKFMELANRPALALTPEGAKEHERYRKPKNRYAQLSERYTDHIQEHEQRSVWNA